MKDEPHRRFHAIIDGALGQGNAGDDALLSAFLARHEDDYQDLSILTSGPHRVPSVAGAEIMAGPKVALGRRFWFGMLDRRRKRSRLVRKAPDAWRDLVWLGGLLGYPMHIRVKEQSLLWAREFCRRFVYYFGDAEYHSPAMPEARAFVRALDETDNWVAVRSQEAAALLHDTGFKGKIRVGIDAVLYDRARARGLPFTRRKAAEAVLALAPARNDLKTLRPYWLELARAGIRQGLKLRWISFCDADDLPVCRELCEEVRRTDPGHPQEVRGSAEAEESLWDAACCAAGRYHSAIFSIAGAVPTILVCYGLKASRLSGFLGLGEWVAADSSRVPFARAATGIPEMLKRAATGRWAVDDAALAEGVARHAAVLESLQSFRGGAGR